MKSSAPHIYPHMIAGCMPALSMDVDEAINSVAGGILQDHRLHVLHASDSEHVYYFAVPSKRVTHAEQFDTPLAIALPGHPEHLGDGIYVLNTPNADVAAVKREGELLLLHETSAVIENMAKEYGLPVHVVSDTTKPWALHSVYGRQRQNIIRAASKTAKRAGYVLGVCVSLYVVLALAGMILERVAANKKSLGSTAEIVKQMQYTSPLSEQLAHFQQISSTVVRAGGWIDGYMWRPGKDEAFEITMPGWVTHDYVEALGPGTTADYNIPDNLVVARKGDLEKMRKQ